MRYHRYQGERDICKSELIRVEGFVFSAAAAVSGFGAFAGMTGIRSYQPSAIRFQLEKTRLSEDAKPCHPEWMIVG